MDNFIYIAEVLGMLVVLSFVFGGIVLDVVPIQRGSAFGFNFYAVHMFMNSCYYNCDFLPFLIIGFCLLRARNVLIPLFQALVVI